MTPVMMNHTGQAVVIGLNQSLLMSTAVRVMMEKVPNSELSSQAEVLP